jgi:hypothetical protein
MNVDIVSYERRLEYWNEKVATTVMATDVEYHAQQSLSPHPRYLTALFEKG